MRNWPRVVKRNWLVLSDLLWLKRRKEKVLEVTLTKRGGEMDILVLFENICLPPLKIILYTFFSKRKEGKEGVKNVPLLFFF